MRTSNLCELLLTIFLNMKHITFLTKDESSQYLINNLFNLMSERNVKTGRPFYEDLIVKILDTDEMKSLSFHLPHHYLTATFLEYEKLPSNQRELLLP